MSLADLHFEEFIIDLFLGGRTDGLQLDFFGGCPKKPASEPNNKHPGWNVFSLRTSHVHYSTLLYPARLGSVFVGAWFAWGLDGFLPINHVLIAILEEL